MIILDTSGLVAAYGRDQVHAKDVLDILQAALSQESWKRLRDLLTVPLLRLYGRVHIRQWAQQARTKAYIDRLRGLISSRRRPATGPP